MLGAHDGVFFGHYFFPGVCRQASPQFAYSMDDLMERNRFVNIQSFRGSMKTTRARLRGIKRIAYGLAKNQLYVGKSEGHAADAVGWMMQQVEYNTRFATAFGLVKGKPWTQTECVIINSLLDTRCNIMALGMTGSVRGINKDSWRPDTIIVDDPCDEENTATAEQRQKISDLFFGALKESLAPRSEEPQALMALLQTPLDANDLTAQCEKSPDFVTMRQGVLTSQDLKIAESAWPERWTKQEILLERDAAIARNQLSLWLREKMCVIVAREQCAFSGDWLQYWEVLPPHARFVMAIDPAPIRSDKAVAMGVETDLQAVMVCCYWQGKKWIVEYETARDQDPEALAGAVDRLARKYPILRCGVEGVAYQRTLKWFLEREMKAGRIKHLRVMELKANKDKRSRILQSHTGRASSGCLFVHNSHSEFIEQFIRYPGGGFVDLLDVSAMCDATYAEESQYTFDEDGYTIDESTIPDREWQRGAP